MSRTHTDHLGSTVLTTGVVGDKKYTAYGAQRSSSVALPTDRTYTGQVDDGSYLLYYGARYYDPRTGQFMSPDTLVPDADNVLDYNRYLYARANPLKNNDPTGHCPESRGKVGSPESECWTMAQTILQQWDRSPDYWNNLFNSKEVFEEYYLHNPGFNNEHMNGFWNGYLNSPDGIEAFSSLSGDCNCGEVDFGDYTSIAFGLVGGEVGLTLDDYGNVFLRYGAGPAMLGPSIVRGDIPVQTDTGVVDIDRLGLDRAQKRALSRDLMVGEAASASVGAYFATVGISSISVAMERDLLSKPVSAAKPSRCR